MGLLRAGRFLVRQLIKRNTEYLKRASSGKDLVIYCDYTKFQWHSGTTGFSGSEEAVIHLAKELAKLEWDVTIYNNCGHKPVVDAGVTYRPFWEFNPRDRQDVVILWRWLKPLDWDINADKIFIDMHDVVPETMLTKRDRLAKVTRVFVKSRFQRSFYPSVPDEKMAVIANGIDFGVLEGNEQKDRYLLINTSAADRSMSVLPKLFREVRRRVPQARLQWSVGWGLFELFNAHDPEKIEWMQRTKREMADAGIESLGHLTDADLGRLYRRGAIFAYPTDFLENDCISVKKAQACGCVPVTTDAGALADSVQFGIKIPYTHANTRNQPGRFHFGIEDETAQRLWIDATVDLLNSPEKTAQLAVQGASWARQFAWPQIAACWHEILKG
jgi:glycosyltransferase involved in cell wall biosynthesis